MKLDMNQNRSLRNNVFNINYLNSIEKNILSSPYLSKSQLNKKSFSQTKGFSIIFNAKNISCVNREFPYLKQYLQWTLHPKCNAFYLNTLVLQKGGIVKPHVDCSISKYFTKTIITPKLVSVFYVYIPSDMKGGEIVFLKKGIFGTHSKIEQIKPQTNSLLYFNGVMMHSVQKMQTLDYRISLVCEQYILNEKQLQEIPDMIVESGAYS